MEVTFLIGNGFDIGVGMRSRFMDYFRTYRVDSLEKPKRIKMLSENIGADHKTWADFEVALGEYTEFFSPNTKKDFIDQIKDFELGFINYLNKEEALLSYGDTSFIKGVMEKAMTHFYSTEVLNPVSSNRISRIFADNSNSIVKYNFINFNYTDVLNRCITETKKNKTKELKYYFGEVINVHGKSNQYPIIGVNDVSQIKNKTLANDPSFSSRIVKPTINQLIGYNNEINAKNLIDRSTIVIVYGMSIGKTDALWWNKIVSWLNANSYHQLVLFDYDPDFQTLVPFDWIDKNEYLKNRILSFNTNKNINTSELKNRIHIAIHKNIFEMDLMKHHRDITEKAFEELKKAKDRTVMAN